MTIFICRIYILTIFMLLMTQNVTIYYNRYLFYFAFENTIEPGYVTEKVFDALNAGVVPVYVRGY